MRLSSLPASGWRGQIEKVLPRRRGQRRKIMARSAEHIFLVLAFIGYGLSAYHQGVSNDDLDRGRKQFQYGRSLVAICRHTVHDVARKMDCEHHALFPSRDASIPYPVISGAYFQMMVMEQEAGQFSLYAVLVRGEI